MSKFLRNLCPSDSNGQLSEETYREMSQQGDFEAFALEPKYDGSRYLLHLHFKGHHFTSRRKSVKTNEYSDKIEQVSHIKKLKILKQLEGIVLDGEAISKTMKLNGKGGVSGMLNSLPKRSRKLQKKYGKIKFMIFNILADQGSIKIQRKPLSEKRKRIKEILHLLYKINPKSKKFLVLVPQIKATTWKEAVVAYKQALKNGFEGLMIKDNREIEKRGVWKWKVYRDCCVKITGYKPGKNKYKNQIGSIKFSVYDRKKWIEVGQCSGFTDKLRRKISKDRNHYIGKIIEVRGQEPSANGRIRHARFRRFRSDYPIEKVTLQKMRKDMTLR